jgi:hypothetical protein
LVGTLTCANGTADVGVLVGISVGVLVGASVGALVGASVGCKVGIVVLVGTATIPVGVGASGAFCSTVGMASRVAATIVSISSSASWVDAILVCNTTWGSSGCTLPKISHPLKTTAPISTRIRKNSFGVSLFPLTFLAHIQIDNATILKVRTAINQVRNREDLVQRVAGTPPSIHRSILSSSPFKIQTLITGVMFQNRVVSLAFQ